MKVVTILNNKGRMLCDDKDGHVIMNAENGYEIHLPYNDDFLLSFQNSNHYCNQLIYYEKENKIIEAHTRYLYRDTMYIFFIEVELYQ